MCCQGVANTRANAPRVTSLTVCRGRSDEGSTNAVDWKNEEWKGGRGNEKWLCVSTILCEQTDRATIRPVDLRCEPLHQNAHTQTTNTSLQTRTNKNRFNKVGDIISALIQSSQSIYFNFTFMSFRIKPQLQSPS